MNRRDSTAVPPGSEAFPGGVPRGLYYYAVGIALFHLWANTAGTIPTLWQNALHLALFGSFAFLYRPEGLSSGLRRGLAFAGAAAVFGAGVYLIFAEDPMHMRGVRLIWSDQLVALLAVAMTLWLCRRGSGWIMPVLVVLCAAYALVLGRYIDGVLHFRGLGLERLLYRYYFTGEGLFGFVATISSSFVFLFLLFSAFLLRSGAGEFVPRLAAALTGRLRGGPGYVAILSSALTGTVSGSAVANTVATGSITIPMMQRAGFRPAFAAGVESAASTGGQLMPPIMGAGAFLIAQFSGLPYVTVIAAAFLPAVLYFATLVFFVALEARHLPLPEGGNSGPPRRRLWRESLPFLIPLVAIVGMLVAGFTPTYAAVGGIAATVAASWIPGGTRMGVGAVADALALGVRLMAPTAILLLSTGLVVGSLNMTGAAVGFSQMILSWSGGMLGAALVLTAVASLILGMGLPVTAAYVMLAIVGVPALQELGVALLAAHLVIFWLSQDSNVTPPVCLTAFAAAGIARCPPFAAAIQAWKLAKGLYLIPILFVYGDLIDGDWPERVRSFVFGLGGLFAFAAAIAGAILHPLRWPARLLLAMVGAAVFWPEPRLQVIALVTLALLVFWSHTRRSDTRPAQPG